MKQRLRLDITHPALYPDVAELLRRIPAGLLYHQKHSFRHPTAIYQLSLRQLATDITRLELHLIELLLQLLRCNALGCCG